MNEWDYIKLKALAQPKKHQQNKRQPTKWEKIFANNSSDKELYSNYTKNSNNSTTKTSPNNPIKNGQRT